MQLQTLGGLALQGSRLGRPKPLLLLTYLALEGAKDRHHLAELFWPDAAEPLNSLRVALAQLRAAAPDALGAADAGLVAKVDADAVGLLRALDADDPAKATELYRGAFLAGFYLAGLGSELEEWVYSTREFLAGRVREAWLGLAERDAAVGDFRAVARRAETALGLPGAAPPEPEGLERLYRLLVAGGSAKAGDLRKEARGYAVTFSFTREEVRQQLRPSSEVNLAGRESPHNLPLRVTSFVGRDPELVELAKLLAEPGTRLITLIGAGGVGKTRLAVQAALGEVQGGRFAGGVYFVALDALSEPALIPAKVAKALELVLPGKAEPLRELASALEEKQLLIVLDNFEHLLQGAAIVSELLRACPGLKLLVTSRERLGLEDEQLFVVDGLPLPETSLSLKDAQYQDAVQLFVQRAKRAQLDFTLAPETLPHVLIICRRLDGSPLATELAAAWVRMMPVAEIGSEIERNIDFLTTSAPDMAERHRSLRATFEHSWKLLSVREQQTLRQLSVFVGGFTREAASRVAGATIPLLASLVDKSLLRVLGSGRFDRHPLLYSYTREKLAAHPNELEEAEADHAAYFLALAEEAVSAGAAAQVVWLARLEAEHDNLRVALERSLGGAATKTGLQLAVALYRFWYYRSHFSEGRYWLERALGAAARISPPPTALKVKALHSAGVFADEQGDYARAVTLYEESLALARMLGDPVREAISLNSLGVAAWEQRDYAEAQRLLEASLDLRRSSGRRETLSGPLSNLGLVALAREDYDQAERYLEESLTLSREFGNEMGVASGVSNLGLVMVDRGDHARAGALFEEGLALHRELGDKDGVAHCLEGLAAVAALKGYHREAARLCGFVETLRKAIAAPLSPLEAAGYERRLLPAWAALGDAGFAAARTEGRTLALEEAVALGLSAHRAGDVSAEY